MRLLEYSAFVVVLALLENVFAIKDIDKFDCYPERISQVSHVVNRTLCVNRGCLWASSGKQGIPPCYYPSNFNTYKVINKENDSKKSSKVYELTREEKAYLYGNHVDNITVSIERRKSNVLRIKIFDRDNQRYEVPMNIPEVHKGGDPEYSVEVNESPFALKIRRKSDNNVLWDTSVGPLIFSDQYLQLSTTLSSHYIYGFGEQEHPTFKRSTNWTTLGMFTRDQFPFAAENRNVYGVHPFYMNLEESGNAHGVLLLNSNAMDVTLQPKPALTYRTIGGVLDFYIFLGPTPENVIQQYTELVGRTFMPPYWSLGFQLCRYGYKNLAEVKDVVEDMKRHGIPQDVQYGDIDYMERQLDFTYDKNTFGGLPEFVDSIRKDGLKYIIILDPAISVNETKSYPPYTLGSQQDVWIKDNDGNTQFGKVWPDYPGITFYNTTYSWDEQTKHYRAYVAFPDFLSKNTNGWWKDEIAKFYKIIKFDGLWIDMNEPANFVHGSVTGCSQNKLDYPPYKPYVIGDILADKTLCMNSMQAEGKYRHYDVHSLYGWSQAIATQPIIREVTGKRSVVISRSTFVGSGNHAGHWLGDNLSKFYEIHRSIVGMFDFNLFGIPYIGADICGFIDDTTADLCQRWMQVGAFYPFSRNHNVKGAKPQHPTVFGDEIAKNSRDILLIRYTLLPYLYTLFYEAHTKGSSVIRPLLNEFTSDRKTWDIDRQFLWGPALLISPALDKGQTTVDAYFPDAARWYNYYNGEEVTKKQNSIVTLQSPQNHINLHVRGGYIIPTQQPANNTEFSRRNPFGLVVCLDKNGKASGNLFWDDGDSIDTISQKKFLLLSFAVEKNTLSMNPVRQGIKVTPKLDNVIIFGILKDEKFTSDGHSGYDADNKVLNITRLNWDVNQHHKLTWSTQSLCRPLWSTKPLNNSYKQHFASFSFVFFNLLLVIICYSIMIN